MNRTFLLLPLLFPACAGQPEPESPDPQATAQAVEASSTAGPTLLWGGGDPLQQGWRMCGPGEFVVEGDALRADGGMGMLWYAAKDFKDFRLDLQWSVARMEDNAGIFVRFPNPGEDPWVAVHGGYELQICDVGTEDRGTGSVYSFQGPSHLPTRPIGDWNEYSITVVGQEYTVAINGEVVNRYTGDRSRRGYIGLQNHDPVSQVRFREIRVTEL